MGTVTTKVVLDASSYSQGTKAMAAELKRLRQEMKTAESQAQLNGTKLEQLGVRHTYLGKQLKQTTELTQRYKKQMDLSSASQEKAKKALSAANKAYDEGRKIHAEDSKELSKLEKEVVKQEKAYARATKAVETNRTAMLRSQQSEADLKRQIKETAKELDTQRKYTRQVSEAFDDFQAKNATLRTGLTKTGKVLTTGVTLPIIAGLTAATKASVTLNSELANIATNGIGAKRLSELKKGIQDIAVEVGKDTSDIANGMYEVISAYEDSEDTIEMTRINAKAATAGLATTQDALNLTSAVTRGYGEVSAEATQRAADLAFEAARLGQTTFPELAASIGSVIPQAKALGVTQEELFAVFATLTGVTGNTAEVSTQLGSIWTALMKPSGDMTQALKQMGYQSGFSAVKALGLKGTLEGLVKATNGSDEELVKLAGRKEAVTAMLALTGAQAEKFTYAIDTMNKSVGAMDEAFEAQVNGVNKAGFTFQQAMVKMQVAAQNFGDSAAPFISKGADAINRMSEWLSNLSDDDCERLVEIGAALATVGPALMLASKGITLVNGVRALIAPLGAVGGAIGEVVDAADEAVIKTKGSRGLVGAFMAIPTPAKVAVAAIAGVSVAVWAGKKAYDSWYDSQYRWSEGLSDGNKKIQESLDKYKELSSISQQVKSLKMVIENPDSSKAEVADAKAKLEEIAALLSKEYDLVINHDGSNVEKALDTAKKMSKNELVYNISQQRERLDSLQPKVDQYKTNVESMEAEAAAASEAALKYGDLKLRLDEINKARDLGEMSWDEWTDSLKAVGRELGFSEEIMDDFSADRINNLLPGEINKKMQALLEQGNKYPDLAEKIKNLTASYEEWTAIHTEIANQQTEIINTAALEGDAETVEKTLNSLSDTIKSGELDAEGYAQAVSNALNGITLDQAWEQLEAGDETGLNNWINDYISNCQKFGVSMEEAGINAALFKNKLNDLEDINPDNVEAVNKSVQELADEVPELKDIKIEVSADGDTSIIKETKEGIEAISKDKITVTVDAEGNIEILDKTSGKVQALNGLGASVSVNAEGNIEILDEAGVKIATIDGQTGRITVNGEYPGAEEIEHAILNQGELTNTNVALTVTGSYPDKDLISSALEHQRDLADTEVTYTVHYKQTGTPPTKNADGTQDFKGGLAMINDQKGISDPRELVEVNGRGYIFDGKDVVVPLPKHSKVYTAAQTKSIMRNMGIPHYAKGKNNTPFENAKHNFEHRKKTSEVTILDELNWWKEIQVTMSLAAEEAEEVEEQIYSLSQKLNDESVKDYQNRINNQIEDGERWLDSQVKLYGISAEEQIDILNRIDKRHLETLDEMVANTELSEKEKEELYQEYYEKHEDRIIKIAELERKEAKKTFDALLEDSRQWVSDRSFFNDWMNYGDDPIAAYGRVKQRVDEAISNATDAEDKEELYEGLVDFGNDFFDEYMENAERLLDTEEYFGNASTEFKLNCYNEQRKAVERFYNAGVISYRQYIEAMQDIDKKYYTAVNERLAEDVEAHYDNLRKKLDDKRAAIEKEYEMLEENERADDREAELNELRAEEQRYSGAVTLEGQKKLKEIREQIEALEDEKLSDARRKEKENRLAEIDDEYEKLDDMEKEALKRAENNAEQMARMVKSSCETAASGLTNIITLYTGTQEQLLNAARDDVASFASWANNVISQVVTMAESGRALLNGEQANLISNSSTTNNNQYTQNIYNNISDTFTANAFNSSLIRSFVKLGRSN